MYSNPMQHIDKVTYQVQFAKPGTYYLYMRFTMFENGGNANITLTKIPSFFLQTLIRILKRTGR